MFPQKTGLATSLLCVLFDDSHIRLVSNHCLGCASLKQIRDDFQLTLEGKVGVCHPGSLGADALPGGACGLANFANMKIAISIFGKCVHRGFTNAGFKTIKTWY